MSKELLLVAEAVSNEKGVSKEVVLEAIQAALESATRKRSGKDIGAEIVLDAETGEYETYQYWDVLEEEEIEFPEHQITVAQAAEQGKKAKVGDRIKQKIESVKFGRIAAQAAKQVIIQKVREAERHIVVEKFTEQVGELVTGIVKKVTRDYVLLDLGSNAEAMMSRREMLSNDVFRLGDRVRAYLFQVEAQIRGPQLFVSRTRPEMLIELFKIEVPEIGEEVIEVKAAARDPGARAKIAVKTNDGRIDPVGACVGMRGARVQAVSSELGGERIDIILWDENPAQLVINSMAPAEVASLVIDEDSHSMDLAVSEEKLSQAIGRSGQNVRLARELTGWQLNVMNEEDFANKGQEETQTTVQLLMDKLSVDQDVATMLVEEGFSSVEEIAYLPEEEFSKLQALDEELLAELRNRANDVMLTQALVSEEERIAAEPTEELINMEGMDEQLAVELAAKLGVRTVEDLAEQAVDDLTDLGLIDPEKAGQLIMKAREPWFVEN